MTQIELAIKYLRKRAVSTTPLNQHRIERFAKVLPASEVYVVLQMVESNEFIDFFEKMKSQSHPDFI